MFNPADWYWIKEDGAIYSSASQAFVEADDAAFVAWRSAGATPTPYPRDTAGNESEAALQDVLSPYGIYLSLAPLRVGLKATIDAAAEVERKKYITAGEGQALTYQRKAEEARACLSASDPQPADYPMLAAEIGITADTLIEVAEVVNAANAAWLVIGAEIEAARLGAKVAIDAASTAEEARAAAEAVAWPNT